MEYEPYGGRRIQMSQSEKRNMRRKIIKGGKIADEIRKVSKAQHEEHELPQAEEELARKLQEMEAEKMKALESEKGIKQEKKPSFFQRIINFIKHIFLP